MYRILAQAITGKFVPDGGVYEEFDNLCVARMTAWNRTMYEDSITRRVVDQRDNVLSEVAST